jgi:photosynthetic reaction center H subunit
MPTGAITGYIDIAQLCLYAFWIFFAGLIFYLHRENKREGYPLESERSERASRVKIVGFPKPPPAKTFLLADGGTYLAPPGNTAEREIAAKPVAGWPGAPLMPTGNPMLDGVGPAAYVDRADEPERTFEGVPLLAPMRVATDAFVEPRDPDPRGMQVVAADKRVAGTVQDLWIDRAEPQIRYLEVELTGEGGAKRVLLPIHFARINADRRQVKVKSILAHQFADVPGLRNPDQVTKREEDRITAYYAGGTLYATPARLGPVL